MGVFSRLDADRYIADCDDGDPYIGPRDGEDTEPLNTKHEGEPMSINRLFDNSRAWLEDEPWRTW